MKYFLTALMLIGSAYAQQKHDIAIIVTHLPFKTAMVNAPDHSFNIAAKDDSLQFFTTSPKADKYHNLIVLHIRVKDSITIITGDSTPT